jgi:hypothetical protein
MKKILFMLFAALAFVACEKYNEHGHRVPDKVTFSPSNIKFDRSTGGTAVVSADIETYPKYIIPVDVDDPDMAENFITLWGRKIPTPKEVRGVRVYAGHGCKITVSDDLKQYNIEVEENCEWDYLQIATYTFNGEISRFRVILNPELYDTFDKE